MPDTDVGIDPNDHDFPLDPGDDTEPTGNQPPDLKPGVEVLPEEPDTEPVPEWDGSAPEGPEGMEVYAVVSCTLFRDPVEVTFIKTNDPWLWDVVLQAEGSLRVPELEPCYPGEGGDMPIMLWDPEPRITILSDGMVHTLEQTMRTDFWEGSVLPMEGSSYACDEALLQLGLTWPLPLTMTVLGPEDEEE